MWRSMSNVMKAVCLPLLAAAFAAFCMTSHAAAQDAAWRVSRASGEVSVTASGAQPVALTDNASLNPGDVIRTGQNGRVLLTRGTESMLISSNSVVGIAKDQSGMTTILERAGSILFDVEKKGVKHFQVETPYLAAVVKGTQFRVSVDRSDSSVEVLRGQVEVLDFRSGQYAQVFPQQTATVSSQGAAGLSLSGGGRLSPIEQGTPRNSLVPAMSEERTAALETGVRGPSIWTSSTDDDGIVRTWFGETGIKLVARIKGAFGNGDNEDSSYQLGLPVAAGLIVWLGAAIGRRRQKQKPEKKLLERRDR